MVLRAAQYHLREGRDRWSTLLAEVRTGWKDVETSGLALEGVQARSGAGEPEGKGREEGRAGSGCQSWRAPPGQDVTTEEEWGASSVVLVSTWDMIWRGGRERGFQSWNAGLH